MAKCADCGLPYNSDAWCDTIVPDEIWKQITPSDHPEGGLLCFNCIARRCVERGLQEIPLTITSGPFIVTKSDEPGVRWFFKDPLEGRAV